MQKQLIIDTKYVIRTILHDSKRNVIDKTFASNYDAYLKNRQRNKQKYTQPEKPLSLNHTLFVSINFL